MKYRLETEIGNKAFLYEVGPGSGSDRVALIEGIELGEKIVELLNFEHRLRDAAENNRIGPRTHVRVTI